MNIQELKLKSSEQLITQAEELGIENASTLRKQEILFAILKKVAEKEEITGAYARVSVRARVVHKVVCACGRTCAWGAGRSGLWARVRLARS